METLLSFRRYIIVAALVLLSGFSLMGQTSKIKKLEAEADNHFKFDRNYEALGLYLQLDSLQPNNAKTLARIGICYLYHIKTRSLRYLLRAKELNYKEDHIDYYLARAYHLNHQFDKAVEFYNICKPTLRSKLVRQDIELYIKNCQVGKELIKDSVHVKIENLGPTINSEYPEYAPVLSVDESSIIFTSERPAFEGKNNKDIYFTEDVFISNKVNGEWETARSIGYPVCTKGNDASIAFSMDGGDLFIYKSDSLNPTGGNIYVTRKKGEQWTIPTRMNGNVNSDGWEPSLSLSPQEDVVFFSSNRAGGFGGLDLYVSKKMPDGTWGPAKNLGNKINTPYDDDAPYMHPDGKTLYFSTKGHPSIGGFDIYTCTYDPETGELSEPVNIGYPINTADDEIFFIWSADGTRGYFSSAREDSYGRSDIYMVTRPAVDVNLILFSGNISTIDNKIVPATITITDNATNKIIGYYDSTKFHGNYAISLYPGQNYAISIESKGYMTYSENIYIPVNGFHDIKKDVRLVPIQQGGLIVLKNVLFEPGKAVLNENASNELNRYSKLIEENPNLIIEVAGHAFDLEDHKSNLELSEQRANAVRNYLIKKGAKGENLRAVGYGDKFKVSEEDKDLNTRTELVIQQVLTKTEKEEVSKGYYYKNPEKALKESRQEVNNSIKAKFMKSASDYLVKQDEDIYLGVNNSGNLKEFKANEEVKAKVKQGMLKPVIVKGVITDDVSGKGIYSFIDITDNTGKKISETKTSADGKYSIEIYNSKDRKYTITVHADGYNYRSKDVTVPANSSKKIEVENNFKLSELEVGQSIILHNIYFDVNSSVLKQDSYKELKKLEKLMKKNKNLKLEISAHTDDKGSDDYNKILSQRRADAVVHYLTGKGVTMNRLIAKGYGEERPLASNDDEAEGRELNRRIEFQILEK